MKKVTDLKNNEAIHCKTETEAKAICKLMHEAGLKWRSGISYIELTQFRGDICYFPNEGSLSSLERTNKHGETSYPASDFICEFVWGEEIEVREGSAYNWNKRTFIGMGLSGMAVAENLNGGVTKWREYRKLPTENNIEIKITLNGKDLDPSEISEDTWSNLRNK